MEKEASPKFQYQNRSNLDITSWWVNLSEITIRLWPKSTSIFTWNPFYWFGVVRTHWHDVLSTSTRDHRDSLCASQNASVTSRDSLIVIATSESEPWRVTTWTLNVERSRFLYRPSSTATQESPVFNLYFVSIFTSLWQMERNGATQERLCQYPPLVHLGQTQKHLIKHWLTA